MEFNAKHRATVTERLKKKYQGKELFLKVGEELGHLYSKHVYGNNYKKNKEYIAKQKKKEHAKRVKKENKQRKKQEKTDKKKKRAPSAYGAFLSKHMKGVNPFTPEGRQRKKELTARYHREKNKNHNATAPAPTSHLDYPYGYMQSVHSMRSDRSQYSGMYNDDEDQNDVYGDENDSGVSGAYGSDEDEMYDEV